MSFQAKSLTITNHQSTISQLTRDNKACGFTPVKEDDKQMKQTWTSQGKDQTFVCWPKQINKIKRTCHRFTQIHESCICATDGEKKKFKY